MPLTPPLPPLHEEGYRRYMRLAHRVSKFVGMRLKLLGNERSLNTGHIFLFNHFTRFETTVPPYLLHQYNGAICRSVAHHSLFRVHKWLTRFMWDTACVPSNMPGLLPLLAEEVLRGRRVIIFPEGGLVKDKKVMDESGDYAISGGKDEAPRKHHKGAAVLATYLDIFKSLLRDAEERGNTALLAHWQKELGLTEAALRIAIHDPTRVVPSTLTFFPIRSEGNFISNAVEMFFGKLPDAARDELITETNLLLRPTDLDVYVGKPIFTEWNPPASELAQWQKAFEGVKTMEQFFAMEFTRTSWLQTNLAKRPEETFARLRDRSMRALYGGLTVNIHHLMAVLIHYYITNGRTAIPAAEFEAALLWAGHRLQMLAQKGDGLPLHSSIGTFYSLNKLALGTHSRVAKFLETLEDAKLVKKKNGAYHLSQRLLENTGRDEIRLENPVQLHVNEAAPQPAVHLAVRWAAQQALKGEDAEWAEMVAQTMISTAYESYARAGAEGLAAGAGAIAPFLLRPTALNGTVNGIGLVVIHGLGSTPAQVRGLAEDLRAQGYLCLGPTPAGHGGKPADLHRIKVIDWLATATLSVRVLKALGAKQVQLIGFSAGSLVAFNAAPRVKDLVQQVVMIAPPIQLKSRLRHLLTAARFVNMLVAKSLGRFIPGLTLGVYPWYAMHPQRPTEQYSRVPLYVVAVLRKLSQRALKMAPTYPVPVRIVQGDADRTSSMEGTQSLLNALPAGATLQVLQGAPHDIVYSNTQGSWGAIISAIQSMPTKPSVA